jgi:hypothetical protein
VDILLSSSTAWETRDKLIGTLIVPGGLATTFVDTGLTVTARTCVSGLGRPTLCTPGPSTLHNLITIALLGICFFGPIFTAVYLARRAR